MSRNARRKARRTRSRRNPRRTSTRRRSRAVKRKGRIRPVVIVSGGSFHRPKRSKYFKGRTVINRRRSKSKRRYSRRPMRMNPFNVGSIKRILELRNIFHYLSIGGGILAGAFLTRFFTTGNIPFAAPNATAPAWASPTSWWGKLRPIHGLIHVIVGSMAASKAKNPYLKDGGIGMASIGGYDLLTQLLSLAGMKGIPTLSGMDVSVGMNYDRGRGVLSGRAGILHSPGGNSGILLGADDRGGMTMAEEIQSHIMGG